MRYWRHSTSRIQELAYDDPEVVELVDLLVAHPTQDLVVLAGEAIVSTIAAPNAKAVAGLVGLRRHLDPSLVPVGLRVYALGVSISQQGTADWIKCRRGAVLERLVAELIRLRPATVLQEQKIALTKTHWTGWTESRPKDVLVDSPGGPFEVFECKRSPAALGGVDQILLDELGDIQETGEGEGRDTRTCIAWLVPYEAIYRKMRDLDIRARLYYASRDDLLALRDGPPEGRLDDQLGL